MILGGRPLAERRILLTRRPEQSEPLARRLADLGATVVFAPAIEVGPPDDLGPLDEALRELDGYEWLVFTSPNAVAAVKARLETLGHACGELGRRARGPGGACSKGGVRDHAVEVLVREVVEGVTGVGPPARRGARDGTHRLLNVIATPRRRRSRRAGRRRHRT